jgi:prepilin peptidase CpaA
LPDGNGLTLLAAHCSRRSMTTYGYLFGFAIAVSAIGAAYDWRTGHIPNWLTLGALAVGIVGHGFLGASLTGKPIDGLSGAGYAVLGAAVCAAIPLFLYRMGAIGGGDVKLLAAIGAILRPMMGVEAELYGFVAAAIAAPGWLAYHGKLGAVLGNTIALVKNPFLPEERRRDIPPEMLTSVRFGPAIFVGTCGAAMMHWSGR